MSDRLQTRLTPECPECDSDFWVQGSYSINHDWLCLGCEHRWSGRGDRR